MPRQDRDYEMRRDDRWHPDDRYNQGWERPTAQDFRRTWENDRPVARRFFEESERDYYERPRQEDFRRTWERDRQRAGRFFEDRDRDYGRGRYEDDERARSGISRWARRDEDRYPRDDDDRRFRDDGRRYTSEDEYRMQSRYSGRPVEYDRYRQQWSDRDDYDRYRDDEMRYRRR